MLIDKDQEKFTEKIGSKEERKLKARRTRSRAVWFGLGMMGIIGWSVAVPTLIGIVIGAWIDETYPGTISWTLTFMFGGLFIGCVNAWYWIKKEQRKIAGNEDTK